MAESTDFNLEQVKAPYVYLSQQQQGENGDIVSHYDIRLVQPDTDIAIPTAGLHTIEHTTASLLRNKLDGYIDNSPFASRTGFHLILWGKHSTEEVGKAFANSLMEIRDNLEWKDIPATDKYSCGNYRDHSLFSAKEWSDRILKEGFSSDPFNRKIIKE